MGLGTIRLNLIESSSMAEENEREGQDWPIMHILLTNMQIIYKNAQQEHALLSQNICKRLSATFCICNGACSKNTTHHYHLEKVSWDSKKTGRRR